MRRRRSKQQVAEEIVARLREAGHTALFAGGCVRDLAMDREPKDYDVVTDALPERVVQLFRRTEKVGAKFGVVIVRLGGQMVEVATFRSDGDYADGRHPENVRFSDPLQDARRRDFTINGMFYDPAEERIIDHVGGLEDLLWPSCSTGTLGARRRPGVGNSPAAIRSPTGWPGCWSACLGC